MPLVTGQILNQRYRIVKLLGQGGFGAVYRAWDTSLNAPCALKENYDASPEAARQFAKEASLLANLRHSNLPKVMDHFHIPGQGQYLVMEYIEGQDLQAMLDQTGGPLPETQAVTWIRQVCDALSYLHSRPQPVIHRDLKPANIRITPEGQAVVVDFGIAKVYDPVKRTSTAARAVTPGYAPFEQYGQRPTDVRTDIYALGATLYHLLTGQKPPDSIDRITNDTLVAPRQLNPTISLQVETAILRAMALMPERRWQTAEEFKHAISNIQITMSSRQFGNIRSAAQPSTPLTIGKPTATAKNSLFTATPITKRQWIWLTTIIGTVIIGAILFSLALRGIFGENVADSTSATTPTLAKAVIASTPTTKPEAIIATLTATPTPSGPPIEHMLAGIFIYINYIQMFDDAHGWGISRVEGGDDHVMYTYDGGQSWVDRTPPEEASIRGKIKYAHLYFTSKEKGVVIYLPDEAADQPIMIWFTKNSGDTWTAVALDTEGIDVGAFYFQHLSFADTNTGWLILTTDPYEGQAPTLIYQTTDSGGKWERILEPKSKNVGSLNNCCQTGALFLDDKVGLVTSSVPAYPAAHVNWTKDGGKSWITQDLPIADEKAFANSLCATESPLTIAADTVVVVVNCTEFVGEIQKHVPFLYFTTSQGASWQYLPLPISPQSEGHWESVKRTNEVIFVDTQNGWFFIEDTYVSITQTVETKNQIFRSSDGGQTWKKINTSLWVGQYSFIDAQNAFCAALFNDIYTLVRTSDGGVTWLKFTPKSTN